MNQDLLPDLPLPVALALAALIVGLLGLARMLAPLGRPVRLRFPSDDRSTAEQ